MITGYLLWGDQSGVITSSRAGGEYNIFKARPLSQVILLVCCLSRFSSLFYTFWCSRLKVILKQLFALGSVNIDEYLLSLRLGKYSSIFTEPKANNC